MKGQICLLLLCLLSLCGTTEIAAGNSTNNRSHSKKNITSYIVNNGAMMSSLNERTIFSTITKTNINLYKKTFYLGSFYGLIGMLILLTIFCFLLFNESLYIYHSIVIFSLSALFFFLEDILIIFNISTIQNPEIIKTMLLGFVTTATSLFSGKYLMVRKKFPKFKYIVAALFTIAYFAVIVSFFVKDTIMLIPNTIFISIIVSYFIISVIQFSKKNYSKLYAIATAIPLLFAIDYLLLQPAGMYFLMTDIIHLKIATLIEMVIISFAILYRMRELKENIAVKQKGLRIFLEKQEDNSREKTELYVQDQYLENVIMQYDLNGLEIKLLQYISEGKNNEKIAHKLKVSQKDVEEMTIELYRKLEINTHIREDYNLLDSQPDYIYN